MGSGLLMAKSLAGQGRGLTKRAVDGGDSAASTSIFLASGFSCSQALSQPAPPPLTLAVGQLPAKSKGINMKKLDPKDKQKTDKQEQEKPVEKKPSTSTPPIPERPQPNTTRAQKSITEGVEDKSGNDDDG